LTWGKTNPCTEGHTDDEIKTKNKPEDLEVLGFVLAFFEFT
jgi:hypothetical protein